MKRFVTYLALFLACAVFADAGTISRVTKTATGTTEFGASSVLSSTELNGDFNVIVNEVNGNLSNVNVVAGADITTTKVGDESATASAQDADTSPGDYSSRSLATTLSGELQQLRYKLSQAGAVQSCTRTNGSGSQDVGWVSLPVNGQNLVANTSFVFDADADGIPEGWAAEGAGTGLVLPTTTAQGFGNSLSYFGNDDEGVSYTLDKLKASTQYAVVARVSVTSGTTDMTTTGADSATEWRNVDVDLSGSTYTDYCAIVKTDTTPTNLVVKFMGDGGATISVIREFGVYELSAVERPKKAYNAVDTDDDSSHTITGGAGDTVTDASIQVAIQDSGYYVRVHADGYCLQTTSGTGGAVTLDIEEDGVDMGEAIVLGNGGAGSVTQDQTWPFSLDRYSINPSTGNHTYRVVGNAPGRTWSCLAISLVVERIPMM